MADNRSKKSSLGRGLSALLEEMGAPAAPGPMAADGGPAQLPLTAIAPSSTQPRRHFDELALSELADSIRLKGVLQPILVRAQTSGGYEIIAGERRWRAARMAGLQAIPAIIREMDDTDSFEAALIENVQRADLNPLEEAEGYDRLARTFGHTQDSIASLIGKSRSHIANLLRLLDLPAGARELVRSGVLSLGHAKAVLAAADPDALAADIAARGLNVRQAEAAARQSRGGATGRTARRGAPADGGRDPDLEALELQIGEATGLAVVIRSDGGRGTVTLAYDGLDQLDRNASRLSGAPF
jgi:ParB family chromosome partitioning protein